MSDVSYGVSYKSSLVSPLTTTSLRGLLLKLPAASCAGLALAMHFQPIQIPPLPLYPLFPHPRHPSSAYILLYYLLVFYCSTGSHSGVPLRVPSLNPSDARPFPTPSPYYSGPGHNPSSYQWPHG